MWNDHSSSEIVSMDTSSADISIQYEKSYYSKNKEMGHLFLEFPMIFTIILSS